MSEPAAASPPPELPAAKDVLLMQIVDELRAGNALVRAAIAGQGAQFELTAHDARLADFQADLRAFARRQAVDEVEAATQPVPEAEPARNRHRAPRPRTAAARSPHLRGLPAWVAGPAVAAWEVARHPAQHVVGASLMAAGTAATLVIGGGAVVHNVTSPGTGGIPAPSASIVSATPMLAPTSPSSSLSPSALTKPKTFTAVSAPLNTLAGAPVQGTGGGQGAPGPQPSSQGLAPQVTLVVTHALDLGLGSSGTIRVAAFGGPVSWSATASAAGMMLDVASGELAAGQSAVIGVSITADLQALTGPGSVTISYGDGKTISVPVSWTLIPLPLPSPTDSPTDLPTLPAIGT